VAEPDPDLAELERRLEQAAAAASALLTQVPPDGGWQRPEDEGSATDDDVLARLLARLAELMPPEVWERLVAAVHELLMALRALIDWYLERNERRAQPVEVRDIPIL
jgi:hypothetical protein